MDDIMDIDVYELLDINSSADEGMIKKAYRKKALKCHPDKNPDNPNAAVLFLELSKALELLLDVVKKTEYDKRYNAKKAAKIRHQELDSRRKKLKEDLEMRERFAQNLNNRSNFKTSEQKLAEEIERLRKEGSKQLKEEMDTIIQQIQEEKLLKVNEIEKEDGSLYRIRVKWKCDKDDRTNGGYNTENLSQIFAKYGDIAILVVSQKKNGSALIEFEKGKTAIKAYQLEKGLPENPLKLNWINGEPPLISKTNNSSMFNSVRTDIDTSSPKAELFPSVNRTFVSKEKKQTMSVPIAVSKDSADNDFEAFVFAKLREAEDKKRKKESNIDK